MTYNGRYAIKPNQTKPEERESFMKPILKKKIPWHFLLCEILMTMLKMDKGELGQIEKGKERWKQYTTPYTQEMTQTLCVRKRRRTRKMIHL